MRLTLSWAAILIWAGVWASPAAQAHRLDEYLQGAILSVETGRVDAQLTLTPGVSVFPTLLAEMDTDGDGVISADEQRAYVARVLGDLSLRIDDRALTPHLLSTEFPPVEDMQQGQGQIRIEFDAGLPAGGPKRRLTLENRHMSRFAAYQVNCLVSRDPAIQILEQKRNYTQSQYELDFVQSSAGSGAWIHAWMPQGFAKPLETAALILFAWLALLWGQRITPWKGVGGRRRQDHWRS